MNQVLAEQRLLQRTEDAAQAQRQLGREERGSRGGSAPVLCGKVVSRLPLGRGQGSLGGAAVAGRALGLDARAGDGAARHLGGRGRGRGRSRPAVVRWAGSGGARRQSCCAPAVGRAWRLALWGPGDARTFRRARTEPRGPTSKPGRWPRRVWKGLNLCVCWVNICPGVPRNSGSPGPSAQLEKPWTNGGELAACLVTRRRSSVSQRVVLRSPAPSPQT